MITKLVTLDQLPRICADLERQRETPHLNKWKRFKYAHLLVIKVEGIKC